MQKVDDEEAFAPPITEEIISSTESQLGCKLPALYYELLHDPDGFEDHYFPIEATKEYNHHYVPINYIYGVSSFDSIVEEQEQSSIWDEIPESCVKFSRSFQDYDDLPIDFIFDYTLCGSQGEPRVFLIGENAEGKKIKRLLAENFESFIKGLKTEDELFKADYLSFWETDDYINNIPVTDEMINETEEALGRKLPAAYIELMRHKNGGTPKKNCFESPWQELEGHKRIWIDSIYGIGGSYDIAKKQRSMSYAIPEGCIIFCSNHMGALPGELVFNYRDGESEPCISLITKNKNNEVIVDYLAKNFGVFIGRLTAVSLKGSQSKKSHAIPAAHLNNNNHISNYTNHSVNDNADVDLYNDTSDSINNAGSNSANNVMNSTANNAISNATSDYFINRAKDNEKNNNISKSTNHSSKYNEDSETHHRFGWIIIPVSVVLILLVLLFLLR